MVSVDVVIGLDMFEVMRRAKERVKEGWRILSDMCYASDDDKPTVYFVVIGGATT